MRIVLRPGPGARWSCELLGLWPPVPGLDAADLAWVDHAEAALAGAAVSA